MQLSFCVSVFIFFADIAWAVVFSFVVAIVYEGLKTVRDLLARRSHKWLKPHALYARHTIVSDKSTLVEMNPRTIVPYRLYTLYNSLWMINSLYSLHFNVQNYTYMYLHIYVHVHNTMMCMIQYVYTGYSSYGQCVWCCPCYVLLRLGWPISSCSWP